MPDQSNALARFLEILPEGVDWTAHRPIVEDLLRDLFPVEDLVPEVYVKWRPVVRDGIAFIGARLSPERLAQKLAEQIALPATTRSDQRIMAFIRRIPSLQKIGQTVSRNVNLEPGFRARLAELEDGIHEVGEPEIRAEIERELGAALIAQQQVDIVPGLYAEGSVSAVVRFIRGNAEGSEPGAGVLKVLKPFIAEYFQEDLSLLSELADYFDANQGRYELDRINLRSILDSVRELFLLETDFVNERAHMTEAHRRYAGVPGIRIPRPIPSLSTAIVTAMTDEKSVKIVDAFPDDPPRRRDLARRLIENLVARPLFSSAVLSPFHADPHPGNLRADELTGDIVVLDWALTASLTLEERRCLILLFLNLPLRDEGQMLDALFSLSESKQDQDRAMLKRQIEIFLDALPLGTLPSPGKLGDLIEQVLRAGTRLSSGFLVFRKMLSTLEGVVGLLSPDLSVNQVVAEYALTHSARHVCSPRARQEDFHIPLSWSDLLRIRLSTQFFAVRVGAQNVRSLAKQLLVR